MSFYITQKWNFCHLLILKLFQTCEFLSSAEVILKNVGNQTIFGSLDFHSIFFFL